MRVSALNAELDALNAMLRDARTAYQDFILIQVLVPPAPTHHAILALEMFARNAKQHFSSATLLALHALPLVQSVILSQLIAQSAFREDSFQEVVVLRIVHQVVIPVQRQLPAIHALQQLKPL